MKYIYHHLGLGDHIICNGLVRALINPNEEYCMFVKQHNLTSVQFMYNDIKNLDFIVGDDGFVNNFIEKNKLDSKNLIVAGFGSMFGVSWDEFFYKQHNILFSERWDSFKIKRDFKREKDLFNHLNPKNENYFLIHSKGSDGVDRINYEKLNRKIKLIFVKNYTDNIFDYLYLIENSEEIHCIESSFHLLVDSLCLQNKLYFHTLTNRRNFTHKIKNNWTIV
jgi:hypothetical protein